MGENVPFFGILPSTLTQSLLSNGTQLRIKGKGKRRSRRRRRRMGSGDETDVSERWAGRRLDRASQKEMKNV